MAGPYLGVDVGTSAIRAALIDSAGRVLGAASAGYRTDQPRAGWSEQDPADWASALTQVIGELRGQLPMPPAAIGLCGQTPTLVLVAADGEPVRPALTWQDTRASSQAARLADRLGDPEPLIGTALPWSAANMPAKLAWLAQHEPASVVATSWLLQPKDLIGLWLTGSPVSDPWSSKGLCSVADGRPAERVLAECGWSPAACPPVGPAWERRGVVSATAAGRFGLPAGIPVSVGWSDALAEVLASGSLHRGSGFCFSGTSAIVGAPVGADQPKAAGLFSVPGTCSPVPLLYGPTQSSGAAIAWAARLLDCQPAEVARLAATATGSLPQFVPYLTGERAPLWNTSVRALLLGLSAEHGQPEIARAVLDGILLSARHVLDLVREAAGEELGEIELAGRGTADEVWAMVAAQTLGARVRLRIHTDPELSARGAAMLAAACTGVPLAEATTTLGDEVLVVTPTAADLVAADRAAARYLAASDVALDWLDREIGRVAAGGPR